MPTIGVIGAGAWGTALAQILAKHGRDVLLYARETALADSINKTHENPHYLPGIPLDPKLKATSVLSEAARRDVLLLVPPAQHLRETLQKLKPDLKTDTPLVICSKGVELKSGLLMSQVAQEVVSNPIAVLTGPTFAGEVARGLPGAVTLAIEDKTLGKKLQELIGVKTFRPYLTEDLIGAQLGGAVKNVIAIACGTAAGLKLGDNARAALVTRGIAEIARLAEAMGAQRETLLGMSGVGDLILTCSSMQSRNFSLGFALGEGKTLEQILGPRKAVTEGVHTAAAALDLAKKHGVEMPIATAVDKMLRGEISVKDACRELLDRPLSEETEG